MKNLFFIFILMADHSFSQTIERTTEKIDVDYYKNLPLYPGVIDNKNGNNHIYYYENKVIQFYQDSSKISLQVRHEDSPYKTIKLFSNKTKLLLRESIEFYNFCIGYTKTYNEKGELTAKINYDSDYSFGVEGIIEKIKEDYNIDLKTDKLGNGLSRVRFEDKNCYQLTISFGHAKAPKRIIVFDGNSGELLSDTIREYNPHNDPRI